MPEIDADPLTQDGVIFRKLGASGRPLLETVSPVEDWQEDILVEGCGFDVNGQKARRFEQTIDLRQVRNVRIRFNRFFDSAGDGSAERDDQRQHIVVLRAEDILIEGNVLADGGRIKAGRPGRRIAIRSNHLDFVNDNGITVVDRAGASWPDGSTGSRDISITNNTIVNPTVAGIFFGADGSSRAEGVETGNLRITGNTIRGHIAYCIKGILDRIDGDILVTDNVCEATKRSFAWADDRFLRGIMVKGTSRTALDGMSVILRNNRVVALEGDPFGSGAYFVDIDGACLSGNHSVGSSLGLYLREGVVAQVNGNDWNGARIRLDDGARMVERRRPCTTSTEASP